MTGELARTVHEVVGYGDWKLAPAGGSTGQSWVARAGNQKLYVKEGVNGDLLRRLGELGVSPTVVASHVGARGSVAIQHFIEGAHPDGQWIDSHAADVARLIELYHSDSDVRQGVGELKAGQFVEDLGRRLDELTAHGPRSTGLLRRVLDDIASSAADTPAAELVLTHGDPNGSNLICHSDGTVYLVDWDEARLSDPLRDVGQVLWWYVRPERWSTVLAALGLHDDDSVRRRVHWWSAAESVDVALGLIERGNFTAAEDFARDAAAAAAGVDNPRAWWLPR